MDSHIADPNLIKLLSQVVQLRAIQKQRLKYRYYLVA